MIIKVSRDGIGTDDLSVPVYRYTRVHALPLAARPPFLPGPGGSFEYRRSCEAANNARDLGILRRNARRPRERRPVRVGEKIERGEIDFTEVLGSGSRRDRRRARGREERVAEGRGQRVAERRVQEWIAEFLE